MKQEVVPGGSDAVAVHCLLLQVREAGDSIQWHCEVSPVSLVDTKTAESNGFEDSKIAVRVFSSRLLERAEHQGLPVFRIDFANA